MSELPEFESIQRCPECGESCGDMETRRWIMHHPGPGRKASPGMKYELVICPHCRNYYWRERPLDAGSVKEPRRRRGSVKRNGGD